MTKNQKKYAKTRNKRRSRKKTTASVASLGSEEESREIVLAIRRGKIDALVIEGETGEQVLTLQGSDHPYRVLVETINDGVATLDPAGTILYANSRFGAIFRLPAVNFVGTSLPLHVSPSDREMLKDLISRGSNASVKGEITLNAAEGRARIVRLALTPIAESENRSICVVATELTELVEANEALRSNQDSLQQLSARLLKLQDEERRRIARDLHDITGQKLVAQSIALSQVLNRKDLDEETRRHLSESLTLGKEVGEEVRTLSYLLHPPLLDVLGLASAIRWYAEGFEQRTGIHVNVDIASDFPRLPPDVEVTLFRVIQESLANVHRYSGSQEAFVAVNSTPNSNIKLQIGDSGKGMALGILNSATGAVAPVGVGIQGMKERVRELGGKLEITSRPGKGTVVTATVPLFTPAAPLSAPEPEKAHAVSPPNGQSEHLAHRRVTSRKQILIADDHEMLRRGICTMLETQAEWEICGEAVNGLEAVEKAKGLRPDLVILDINMPILNGLAAVRQILRSSPETKILVFTVHDSEQTAKEVLAAGAHGYLAKNNAGADLLRIVKNLLGDTSPSAAVISATAN